MHLVLAGKQKIHYTFADGAEMVEEYDIRSYDILGNLLQFLWYYMTLWSFHMPFLLTVVLFWGLSCDYIYN